MGRRRHLASRTLALANALVAACGDDDGGGSPRDDAPVKVTSFGQRATGELYLPDRETGRRFRIAARP